MLKSSRAVFCLVSCLLAFGQALRGQDQGNGVPLRDGYRLPMPFPTGGYWPWERLPSAAERAGFEDKWVYAEKLLVELKTTHHWNTVWALNIGLEDAQRFLALAEQAGVWVVLEPNTVTHHFIWGSHASPADMRQTAEKTVAALKQFSALAGYVFVDEPRTINMGFLENMRRALQEFDPSRICLTVAMLRDLEAAAHRTALPVLVTDVYPFGYPRDPNLPNKPHVSRAHYRGAMRFLSELAWDTGKRPWAMPQIFQDIWGLWYYDQSQNVVAEAGAYLHWRMPTVGETRWQIWCAVANNVKGVLFYVLFPPHNPRKKGEPQTRVAKPHDGWPTISADLSSGDGRAMLYPDGTPTPQMAASSEVFRFIRENAALLERLEPLPAEIAYAAPPAYASSFRDPDTGSVYTVVYTDATERSSVASVSFLTAPQSVRDLRQATVLGTERSAEGFCQAQVPLGPGDGTLLALDVNRERRPCLVASQDFAMGTIMQQMVNVKRTVMRKPYGMGWDYCMVVEPEQSQPPASGTLTCQLTGPGGNSRRVPMNSYPKDATVYVTYEGTLAGPDQESLILSVSTDGETFNWSGIGAPELPVKLPRASTAIRFEIKPGARLSSFRLISVPDGLTQSSK